jgi:RNA polymerase sigma-70 factor, ECF subfamily
LREIEKAKTWLFTTLYREFLRTRRREARVSAIEDLPPDQQDPPDVSPDALHRLDAAAVTEALAEVEQVFREPLSLFYLQDLSYVEIAQVLGVPIGTVMSRLSRGKTQLRLRLADKAKGGRIVEFPKPHARP